MRQVTARTADGQPMTVSVRDGNADKPTVLFIHGWTCRRAYWEPQIEALPGEYPVLAPDLPGHGDTPAPDRADWTIEGLAEDVCQLVAEHAEADVILVGHSMGGAVALEAAARLDQQARGVILADTFVIDYGGLDADTQEQIHKSFRDDFSEAIAALVENTSTEITPDTLKERLRTEMAQADPAWALPLWKSLLAWSPAAAFERMQCPVHAINGKLIPESSRERWSAHMTETVMPDSGHFLQMEAPQVFNGHLLDALRRFG
ncbi:pimeloyl-ACP methyl ester carboxylesterase [Natronocella acetinitrilica]|uniref:Pimeloyl-ACP methyl ester carboxylesterase n=1 Tax=Natronocella acetinitrilica TaxID=414046 RepID=A0AAE3KFE8_9GAMM|nr:pimeloyl-ACP methyl ester carboxylesterase [Natronocella acetinitrilica]